MRMASVPLVGLWFAFLALPISGPRGALGIGIACVVCILIVKLLRAALKAGPIAERAARLQASVTRGWEHSEGIIRNKKFAPIFLLCL